MPPQNNRMADVVIQDVRLIFRNFAGREDQYNSQGVRKFSVELPIDVAREMENDGWNIKWPKDNPNQSDPDADARLPHIAVEASYRLFSPQVTLITGKRRTNLTQGELDILDWADIITADVVLNPSIYNINGKDGVKAYLRKMFVTIEEDVLDAKYAHLDSEPEEH